MEPEPDYGQKSYRGSGKLQGKAVIITGGDSGIGRAVALAYAREGADVLISYLNEDSDAKEISRQVEEAGRRCVIVPGDLCDEKHCEQLVERAVQEFGRLDVLVNNAAYQVTRENLEDITTEEFDRIFRTNVHAMFWLCRAALPHLKAGASIINTTSIQADKPSPSLLVYAASKAAIQNFTVGLAQMLGARGIRVNCVAPGPIWTPLIPATMGEEKVKGFGKDTPLGRPGQPAELAGAFVLLASDEASYISAATIGVTGGQPIL